MRCRAARIASTKPVIILIFFLARFVQGETWYIGCVEDQLTLEAPQEPLPGEVVFSPATCCRLCLQAGFPLAGIQGETSCKCSNSSINSLSTLNEDHCNNYCGSGSIQLPCGGEDTYSVYSVKGPYLHTLELDKPQSLIQQDTSVLFEAKTYLAREPLDDDDVPNLSDIDSLGEVDFVWFVDNSEQIATSRPSSNDTIQAQLVHTFLQEGEWTVGVQVKNPVSSLSAFTNVTVVRPLPSDLQVIPNPNQDAIPSCIPVHDDVPSGRSAAAVFIREEVLFEASLAMGINLTFQWSFSDDGSNSSRAPFMQPSCEGIACLRDSQVHTFMTEGVFRVTVNVSNSLGSVQEVLFVIVMKRDITDLNVSLADPLSSIRKLNSSVNFLITMKTTARSELLLEIDFGDGSVYNHSLRDINDTFILGGEQNVAHLHLTASYGEGCELLVSLDHIYRDIGVFHPTVFIHSVLSSNITASASLPEALLIQRMLTDVAIDSQEVYSTNESAIFKVTMATVTENVSCAWNIYYTNVTLQRITICEFMYTFAQAGKYVFEVTVQNLISQVIVERTIVVQDAVTGLQLESQVDTLIRTGSFVSLVAYVTGGTEVNFKWDFSVAPNNLTEVAKLESNLTGSVANHTYTVSGRYNVSVTAFNLVSSSEVHLPHGIVVQDSIQGLSVPPITFTLLRNATVIQVQIGEGTQVDFNLDYGEGLVSPHVERVRHGLYKLHHMFPEAGSYDVSIVAYNSVSSGNATTCVVVEDDIGGISVSAYYPQEDHVILAAYVDGTVPNRTDVKYTWQVGGAIHVSATPLIEISNSSSDVLQVLLKAENQVAMKELEVEVVTGQLEADAVTPISDVQLRHLVYAEIGQLIQFSIQFMAEKAWNLTMDYGDSNSQWVSTTNDSSAINLTHSYSRPGVYLVVLTLASGKEQLETSSALSVQEPLMPLSLNGPMISKFSWPISHQVWEVIPQSGSDILYSWSVILATGTDFISGPEVMTPIQRAGHLSKMLLSFNSSGEYNVTVVASNAISTSTVTMVTTLQEPVFNVALNIKPVLIGNASVLEITVEGGSLLQFDINFGDGSSLHIPLLEQALSQLEITLTNLTSVLAKYDVPKTYAVLGEYHCTVKVFNLVSKITVSAVAQVEERITGLKLTSESGPIIRIGEEVTVIATTETGNDIVFGWFFDDSHNAAVENFNNRSIARHTFHNPGNFVVQVSVRNHLQREPIIAFYSEPFIVQKPIRPESLDLQINGSVIVRHMRGVTLHEIEGGYASYPLTFRASCDGSHVVFRFDYGDGTEEVVNAGFEGEGYGTHVYTQEGNYNVTVHAQNYFSNATKKLATLCVQIPPRLRSLCSIKPCNRPLAYEFGDTSNLTVQLEQGTRVFYNWSMGDETDYLLHGPSVSHKYRVGVFRVTVVIFNQVETVERVLTVVVQNRIQSVEVLVDGYLYQVQDSVDFQAVTGTDSIHGISYQWDTGDQDRIITRTINSFSYRYSLPGTYFVTVTAVNLISNATSLPVEITVQAPIDRLSITLVTATDEYRKSCCSALVNQRIEIMTSMYSGSHISYWWDFGDGSDVVNGVDVPVYHSFNRTGEFTITVFASNSINNGTASKSVFILKDKICYPPHITIVGGSRRTANYSDDIKVATAVGIVCESTDVALFAWTLKDADDSVVSLDPMYASLDRRTAFIKRRKLPYGSYTLTLKVSMNGTIVYTRDSITLKITPTPLVAVIDGGTSRAVSNHTDITLNGSKSYDLDEPNNANLSYTWFCYQLATPSNPCFFNGSGSDPLATGDNTLVFHTDLLHKVESFVFELQIDKQGRAPVKTSQVLYIRNNNPVSVLVECVSCVNGIVNRNDELMLKAVCVDCIEDTTYTWKLWRVEDGSEAPNYNYQCLLTGGTIHQPGPVQDATTTHLPQTNVTNTISDGEVEGEHGINGTDPSPSLSPSPSLQYNNEEDNGEETSHEEVPEASILEEGTYDTSYEEGFPEESIMEDIQQDSVVEGDLMEDTNQTSHVEDSAQTGTVDNSPVSTEAALLETTNQPQEDTTDADYDFPDVTGTTSYVYEEYIYYEDIGGSPTASYNTGGLGPGETGQSSLTEYVPGGTSLAQPSLEYEEASYVEAGPSYEMREDLGSFDDAYNPSSILEDIGSSDAGPNQPPPAGDPGDGSSSEEDNDPVQEELDAIQRGPHIVEKRKEEVEWEDQRDYQIGQDGKSLTIMKDYLDEGLTYAVAVTADTDDDRGEGDAAQFVFVNKAPYDGHCFVTPSEGNELDDIFRVNCNEWVDDSVSLLWMELSFRLNESDPKTILYYGVIQEVYFQLPAGYVEYDGKVHIDIVIEDNRGGRASVCSFVLKVIPKVFAPGESKEEFLYNATNLSSSKLLEYIHNGDHNKVYINIVTNAYALNRLKRLTSEDLTHTLTHDTHHVLTTDDHHTASDVHLLELRRSIRKALLGACGNLPMRDASEIVQRTLALSLCSVVPVELSHEAISRMAEVLDTSTMAAMYCALEENVELSKDILTSVANTASNMIDALALNHTHHMLNKERKKAIDKTTSVISKLFKVQLNIQGKDSNPFHLETNSMKLTGARRTSLSGQVFENNFTRVILPKSLNEQLIQQNVDKMADNQHCQDIEIFSFLQNPYSWGTGGEKITSGATSVEIYSCDNQKLMVENLPAKDGIIMEFHHTCKYDHGIQCNYTYKTAFMSVHQFNVTELNMHRTFHITLEMANQGRKLPVAVLMRHRYQPTPYEYDHKWKYEESDTKLDIFLHPDWFNGTGMYYLALMDAVFDQEVYRRDVAKERPYTLRMWWGDCLFWKPQKDEWLSAGCTALPTSTFEVTRCQCSHLTTFAVSFHPIVTTAKFVDLTMFLRPLTNPIPYSFVSAIIGVYFVLLIYCYIADKNDERKQGLIYLKDNQACDQHYYEITVETGFRTGAGTTARVSIVLHGDDGHSETKELVCDDGRPLFERNSRDRFIISVPESLGNVYKVLVWHNNGGISPSWYLSRIAVRDLITGQKWHFICERWFAVEEDDGKIERAIDVLKEGVGFQKAFWAKGAQYFADYYIWSSIFTRPPYSVFTRVQRLTCCLSMSMGFLSICALRYHIMKDEDLELGLVDVSGEAVLVGIVVALLTIPINFPIIMLFRRAKPNCEPEKPEIFSGMRASDIYCDSPYFEPKKIQTDESWDSGMMENSTAITLQNLQAWARQKWKHRHKSSIFPPNKVAPIEMTSPESESTERSISDQQSIFDFGSISSFGDFSSHRDISDSGLSSSYNHSINGYPHIYLPRHKKVANPKIWLPHSFLYIAWGICLGITLFSAVTTSVLGYRFTRTKAIYWTQSVYFTFLQCIFVTQPAVMAMFTIIKSWRHRRNIQIFDHYDDNIDVVDRKSLHRSRLDLYENDLEKGIAARQRSRYLRFARPPQAKELQKAKERMLKEKNMYTILKDAILYTIVFLCLLWIAYGKDLKDHHPVNTAIINTYVKTPHPFTNISTEDDLWYWLENDMLDTLYWEEWYNGQAVMEDKGTVMNGGAVLIGKASLRQLRVKPETCRIAPEVRHLFDDCYGEFSHQTQSTKSFGPDHSWYYQGKQELHRANKWGYFGSYEGEGYAVSLNNTRVDAARQLSELKHNLWIDPQTRVVMLEFTLYNAPTNLFTSVALLAEMPGTGAVYPFPKIESVLLYRYETAYDYFIIGCEMLFLLLVAVTAKGEIHKAIRMRTKYFYSTWSWIEMGTIIISLTYFSMYVTRFIFVEEVIHRFHSTYLEDFVDVSTVAYWDQCLRDLIGSLLFLIGVKLLHLWRFNRTVSKFGAVLGGAIKEIILFAFYYVLLEGAFTCFGIVLLGTHYYPMKHVSTAFEALASSTVGHSPSNHHMDVQFPAWWPIYSVLHMICVVILLSSLIKAILCHSYKKRKDYDREEVSAGELFKFFWAHFLAFFGILKFKDSNNMGKNALPPEFTLAEIEYQVDELLFKMNAMSHGHSMPEKCHGYMDDSDGTHGLGDDTTSYTSSDTHSFDQARLDQRVLMIETNFYSANPELRELLDGYCLIDEDREKQLRSQLEMEIFRQLQMQRLEEAQQHAETNDSGRDSQSVSDQAVSDDLTGARARALPSIRGEDGRISFPKPLPNLGLLDMQMSAPTSSNHSSHSKSAWELELEKPSSSSDNISQDNLANDDIEENRSQQMGSALFVRRSPQISHHEGEHQTNHEGLERSALPGNKDTSGLQDFVKDYPEDDYHDNILSIEGFPLPNALESLTSSSDESQKADPRHKRKDTGYSRRRLRKTRSQGKGKGRGRYGDEEREEVAAAYLNAGYSSDSDESIPIIPMGPIKYTR